MDADGVTRALEAHFKGLKIKELQDLCRRACLPDGGQRAVLVERLLDAAKTDDIDFFACDLDDLALMQIYARVVAEKLPSTGRRSDLQARLARHLAQGEKASGSPTKTFLRKMALNVEGTKQDRAARKALFAAGKFNTAFDDMEFQALKGFADLFGLPAGSSRQALLLALKRHHDEWRKAKGKRKEPDGEVVFPSSSSKKAKPGHQGEAQTEPWPDEKTQEILTLRQQLAESRERAARAEREPINIDDVKHYH